MSRVCPCRYCATPDPVEVQPAAHPPVELPERPRAFRVHHSGRTQDCVLHPDGRMTMQAGGQVLTSMLTFDEMRERNWADVQIEWDPAPLADEPAVEPAASVVQDAIPLPAP